MKSIEQILSEFQEVPLVNKKRFISEKAKKVMEVCIADANGDKEVAMTAFGVFLYSVIAADDKVAGKEIKLLCKTADSVLGNLIDTKKKKELAEDIIDGKKMFVNGAKKMAEEYMTKWSDEDKESLFFCCIAVCALDRKISDKEIEWLEELLSLAL